MKYNPAIFDQPTEAASKGIILTPEAGLSTDERWEQETAFLRPFLDRLPGGRVLDYGCGIGRLAKVLIESGRSVLGVDISRSMRQQATAYVNSPRFRVLDAATFAFFAIARADAAIAVWVLQHVNRPIGSVFSIAAALRPGARFLVVNRPERFVPTRQEVTGEFRWTDDGDSVDGALARWFTLEHEEAMPERLCAPGAWLRIYRKTDVRT